MYAKRELPTPRSLLLHKVSKFQPNQHSVLRILKKYENFTQHTANAHGNPKSAYNAAPNFQNYSFAKVRSVVPYNSFSNYLPAGNVNNVIKSRDQLTRDSTQVIFQRKEQLQEDYLNMAAENYSSYGPGGKSGNVQAIMPPKASPNVTIPNVQIFKPKVLVVKKSQNSGGKVSISHSQNVPKMAKATVVEESEHFYLKKKHAHPVIDVKDIKLQKVNVPKGPKKKAKPTGKQIFDKHSSNATPRNANERNVKIPEIQKQIEQKEKDAVMARSKSNLSKKSQNSNATRDAKAQDVNITEQSEQKQKEILPPESKKTGNKTSRDSKSNVKTNAKVQNILASDKNASKSSAAEESELKPKDIVPPESKKTGNKTSRDSNSNVKTNAKVQNIMASEQNASKSSAAEESELKQKEIVPPESKKIGNKTSRDSNSNVKTNPKVQNIMASEQNPSKSSAAEESELKQKEIVPPESKKTGNKTFRDSNSNVKTNPKVQNIMASEQNSSKSSAAEESELKQKEIVPSGSEQTGNKTSQDSNFNMKTNAKVKNIIASEPNASKSSAAEEQVKSEPPQQAEQKNNTPPTAQKGNKRRKTSNTNTVQSSKKMTDQVTEIFKRTETNKASKNKPKVSSSAPVNDKNLDFHQVTQELAAIIKNFQQQILDVPTMKAPMEQVPSEMIQPKVRKFFKSPSANSQNKNASSKNATNKSQSSTANKKQDNSVNKVQKQSSGTNCGDRSPLPGKDSSSLNNSVLKHSSLKSFSRGSICKTGEVRRYRSLPHNESTPRASITSGSGLGADPLKQLKEEVHKAIRDRKTFTIVGGYNGVRRALLARGWVEKFHPSYKNRMKDDLRRFMNYTIGELLPLMKQGDVNATCQNLIKSKLLGGYQVDFYWGFGDEPFTSNPDKIKLTLINRLKKDIFSYTNKQGLCEANMTSYWFQKCNLSKLNHPRTYSLGKNGDVRGFIEDFHRTAAMSLLKWAVKMHDTKECKLLSPSGKVPLETFDFALNECCKMIKRARHEDIDKAIPEATDHEWNQFLEYFYRLAHYNNHLKSEGHETEDSLVAKCNYILNNLKGFYPFLDMDGMMNMWILKPIACSQGRGIHICRTLQYVLKTVRQRNHTKYVIQKYIERPLLIFNTKFDIRQWFLISNCCPLTIWMYNEFYVRFSCQTYNLRKLHESIHLTNNSVQHKYKNPSVDAALPRYNMWDSAEFRKYLSDIGYPNVHKDIIYTGMKQSIIAAILIHQEKMVVRKNCFELYGADFMLTEDFQPWLIEINGSPALHNSTPVTARMCPKVMEDVVKVVIDYAQNNKAATGSFEMIYKQQPVKIPENASFTIKGSPLKRSYFSKDPQEEINKPITYDETIRAIDQTQGTLKSFGEDIKKTLNSLLHIIQSEKKRGMLQVA